MNKVERAIIMAAGFGQRMKPVSLSVPKPMIKINGTRMIDSIIKGLINNGIDEIYIVVGYLKEQFKVLEEEYQGLKLIENPYYDTCNNISSLYVAREHIQNAIILDGDQMIFNDSILDPVFEKSGYNAVWCEKETNEWLMTVKNNKVINCSRTGGKKGWQLFSISRWTAEDGARLKKHLEFEFVENMNRKIYWDDVVMFYHFEDYDLGIREMQYDDIVEIDNYEELIAIDESYRSWRNKL